MNRPAIFTTTGWGAPKERPCRVVQETAHYYGIEVDAPTGLPAGSNRVIPQPLRLVPKHLVRFTDR